MLKRAWRTRRVRNHAARRWPELLAGLLLVAGLLASSFPASEVVVAAGTQLELRAPSHVKVGQPVSISLGVTNAGEIAGFETQLLFDQTAADFDGLTQRHNDLHALGRDVTAFGPVLQSDGVSFGFFTCPLSNCLDRASTRHDRGGSGRLQLATVTVVPRKAGTLELRLANARFVDPDGVAVAVGGADTTLRVQVGSGGPTYAAPAAQPRPAGSPTGVASGPFDVSGDGLVTQGDAALVALAWRNLRQLNIICGPAVDPRLDVNHDGCLDVQDLQAVAAHYSPPGAAPTPSTPTPRRADDGDMVVAAAGEATALDAPLSLVVNSTSNDDATDPASGVCVTAGGVCSLRAAMEVANAHPGPDTITFNIPGGGVHVIDAPGGLPTLTDDGTTIDGYTQPGASPNTSTSADNAQIMIEVHGELSNSVPADPTAEGVSIASANNTIRGLAIYNYVVSLLLFNIGAHNNRVVGNYLGTNAAATLQPTIGPQGPGTGGAGVSLLSGAAHNQVGDVNPADRNLVSGNFGNGVAFFDEDTDYNTVYNNLVGLNPQGTDHIVNTKHGIDLTTAASFNVVGGTGAGQRNVVSGNLENGVQVAHSTMTVENQVVGNYIGTDPSGTNIPSGLANDGWGVHIHDGPTNNTITQNVIGNSVSGGLYIQDFANWGNHITNNRIGIAPNNAAIPNQQFGVEVGFNASLVVIGPGNIIANNPEGVMVPNQSSTQITITRNSIYNNRSQTSCGLAGRGIDLAPIDPCDPNSSQSPGPANNGIVAPTLNAATSSALDATASGCGGCTIEVFAADQPAAAPGQATPAGQGATFVGSGVTDGSGHAVIALSGVPVGTPLTATVTDTLGDTSEFATNIAVGSGSSIPSPGPTPPPAPQPLAKDTFSRQVSNGWGTADVGGVWATEASPNHVAGFPFTGYDVNGSAGTMLNDTPDEFRSAYLTDVSAHDEDVSFRFQANQGPASGGFLFVYAVARRSDSGNGTQYEGRVVIDSSGNVGAQAAKTLPCGQPAQNGCTPFVLLGSQVAVPAHFSPGSYLRVHLQVFGAYPTTIRMNVWPDGQAEPAGWQVTTMDNEPILQTNPGSVGVRSLVPSGSANGAVTFTFDDFLATTGPVTTLGAPVRAADTRTNGGPVAAGTQRCFGVVGVWGIPADASAVVMNVTAVNYSAPGWLTAYPAGQSVPATSTVNFDTSQYAIANGAIVKVGSGGQVCVAVGSVNNVSQSAQIVLDVTGYLPANSDLMLLTAPQRLVDTRVTGGPLQAGTQRCFSVAGQAGVPSNATAAVLNVTAVNYTAPGWLTAYPAGQGVPRSSTVNFDTREYAIANQTIVGLGSGQVCVDAETVSAVPGATNVVLDVAGYLSGASLNQMTMLSSPQRLVDTRTNGGAIATGQSRCFTVAGQANIPTSAQAVVLNLTAVGYTVPGWLTAYPAGQSPPSTSTLNFDTSEYAIANGAIIQLGAGGQLCVNVGTVNSAPGASQVVIDVVGYQ